MATGSEILTAALRKLGVTPSESPIEAYEEQDALELLNDMMEEFEESGINFGFVRISNSADTVRIPRGTAGFIKVQLALRLAAEYDELQIPPTLAAEAAGSLENVSRILLQNTSPGFPNTLPIGSGNQIYEDEHQRFFPDETEEEF